MGSPLLVYDQVDWEPAVEKPTSVKGLTATTAIVCEWKKCAVLPHDS